MSPEQKRQKIKEMEQRSLARRRLIKESAGIEKLSESTYVWHNDELILVPKSALD